MNDLKFWYISKDFNVPTKCKRKSVWQLWICAMTASKDKIIESVYHVALNLLCFRNRSTGCLERISGKFSKRWKCRKGSWYTTNASKINSGFVEASFASTTAYLKFNVCSSQWQKRNAMFDNWAIMCQSEFINFA